VVDVRDDREIADVLGIHESAVNTDSNRWVAFRFLCQRSVAFLPRRSPIAEIAERAKLDDNNIFSKRFLSASLSASLAVCALLIYPRLPESRS
jgi:hypothetical protein